jgi:hypothetical protein
MRYNFTLLATLLLALLAPLAALSAADIGAKPNIIVIFTPSLTLKKTRN